MQQRRDLRAMIEVLSLAIVREETEEEFFRRSAKESTNKVAAALYLEIAEELGRHRQSLEARKQRLEGALGDLVKPGGEIEMGKNVTGRDPVCKMQVKDECKLMSTYKGRVYRFCSDDCKKAFDVAPEKYVEAQARSRET